MLEEERSTGRATTNQDDAYAIISGLDPHSQEATNLEALYSGTIVELIALQRKFRPLPEYGASGQYVGDFPLDDPEYLAFIVKLNRFLSQNERTMKAALLNVNLRVEDYLRNKGSDGEPLVISLEDIAKPVEQTIAETNIPPQVVAWFGVGTNLFRPGINEDRSATVVGIK